MGKYVESCGTTSTDSSVVANGGITSVQNIGYFKSLLWTSSSVAKTATELKDIATLNALVLAGDAIFLGDGKFEDTSTEAAFFEDAELGIKIEQTAKIKSFKFTLSVCGCTSAELEKMENKQGRLFIQTSTGLIIGRESSGNGIGWAVSSIAVDSSIPVSDTPVEYTTLDVTFSDHKGDRKNPFRIAVDYLLSEVDQVYSADGTSSAVSTSGSALDATLTVKKDCTTDALSGLVVADLKAVDVNGNVLVIATLVESGSTGVYAISITTALTVAYVTTDGIQAVSGVNYYMDSVTITT